MTRVGQRQIFAGRKLPPGREEKIASTDKRKATSKIGG